MAQFIYAYDLDGGERRTQVFQAGGTIIENQPVKLSSGKVVACAGGDSDIVGVSVHAATNGQPVEVITNRRAVFKCEYKGSSKTSLTVDDIGSLFDYSPSDNKLDLDDTDDATLAVVDFNNEGKYAWVVVAEAARAL